MYWPLHIHTLCILYSALKCDRTSVTMTESMSVPSGIIRGRKMKFSSRNSSLAKTVTQGLVLRGSGDAAVGGAAADGARNQGRTHIHTQERTAATELGAAGRAQEEAVRAQEDAGRAQEEAVRAQEEAARGQLEARRGQAEARWAQA